MKNYFHKIFVIFALVSSLIVGEISAATELSNSRMPALADPDLSGNLLQTTLGLLVVLVVIVAAAWAFKRFGNLKMGAQGQLKVVGGISLGTRERVVLLQVRDKQLLLGVAPGRIQMLHVLDEPLSAEISPNDSFADHLQEVVAGKVNASGEKTGIDDARAE